MSKPDYLHGFGASNRTPGSTREEKTYISPRTTVIRHGLSRSEVVIVGRGAKWKAFHRKDGRLIADLRRINAYGWRYERLTREGRQNSVWYKSKTEAENALLETL